MNQKIDLDTEIQALREKLIKTTIEKTSTIIKNIYDEHPAVTLMTKFQVAKFRKKYNLVVELPKGKENVNPVLTFEQAAFPEEITKKLEKHYSLPTPIQSQTWPFLMNGENLIVDSPPGTGKTLAYALPCILHVLSQDSIYNTNTPIGLIITTTRELAIQVGSIVRHYASMFNLHSYTFYGGTSKRGLYQYPGKGVVHIVVSSFYKILTMCTQENDSPNVASTSFKMHNVSFLVFDGRPADKFFGDYNSIIVSVHPDCQVSIWLSDNVCGRTKKFLSLLLPKSVTLDNFCIISIKKSDDIYKNISQSVYVLKTVEEKREKLTSLILYWQKYQSIITARIEEIDELYYFLSNRIKSMSFQKIHSNLEQCERNLAIQNFKSKLASCLITSKWILKGIDLPNATHVLNYNCPLDIEEYKIYIGSIGRANRKGSAATLILESDVQTCWPFFTNILNFLKDEYVHSELYKLVSNAFKTRKKKKKLPATKNSSQTTKKDESQLDERVDVKKPEGEKVQEEILD